MIFKADEYSSSHFSFSYKIDRCHIQGIITLVIIVPIMDATVQLTVNPNVAWMFNTWDVDPVVLEPLESCRSGWWIFSFVPDTVNPLTSAFHVHAICIAL